jgi:hypothetical protein
MKGTRVPAVSCGIDWAEDHHDVAVVDEHGAVICAERIGNDAAGLARLLELLAVHDPAPEHLDPCSAGDGPIWTHAAVSSQLSACG